MNKKISILVVVLVLAILAGGGFWFVKNQEENNNKEVLREEIVAQEDKQAQKESNIEQVDTSAWQTYKNKEYGFEFKYPAGWNIKENRNPTTYLADRILEMRPENIEENNKNLVFYIVITEVTSDPKEWYQTKYENPDALEGYKGETKELKINNLNAYYVVEDKDEYKQNSYVISRYKILIRPTFRSERSYSGSEADFSYDEYIPYFKSLVYSIK